MPISELQHDVKLLSGRDWTRVCHRDKCQTMVMNVMELQHKEGIGGARFVREMLETMTRCELELRDEPPSPLNAYDPSSTVKYLRSCYIDYLPPKSMERILSFTEDTSDERRAAQAVAHYYSWHRERMTAFLTLYNQARFWVGNPDTQTYFAAGFGAACGAVLGVGLGKLPAVLGAAVAAAKRLLKKS